MTGNGPPPSPDRDDGSPTTWGTGQPQEFPAHLDAERDAFVRDMARREEAARGLRDDLLHDVPLLYGSPGRTSHGDPGIVLARIHRETIVRRHGGGVPPTPDRTSRARLPLERTVVAIAILLLIVRVSGLLD